METGRQSRAAASLNKKPQAARPYRGKEREARRRKKEEETETVVAAAVGGR